MATEKKHTKAKKPTRVKVEVTNENLKIVRDKASVTDYSVPAIRVALKCTWSEASALRKAALKS
jgi:ATP-dependent Clp protease adapter protein ClpS